MELACFDVVSFDITMKTQIDIPNALHLQAKTHAAKSGTTLKALVNEGLEELLKRKSPAAPKRFRKGERV